MPVNAIQIFENRTCLLKIESTYGTDATPTGAANARSVRRVTVGAAVVDTSGAG